MSKPIKQIRWNVAQAAQEFGLNPKTLAGRIKRESIEPGKDRCFSTKEICSAVFGDIEGEKLLLTRQQRIKLEMENAESESRLVDAAAVRSVMERGLAAMTLAVMAASNLENEDKAKIVNHIRQTGESVVGFIEGGEAATELHSEPVE